MWVPHHKKLCLKGLQPDSTPARLLSSNGRQVGKVLNSEWGECSFYSSLRSVNNKDAS